MPIVRKPVTRLNLLQEVIVPQKQSEVSYNANKVFEQQNVVRVPVTKENLVSEILAKKYPKIGTEADKIEVAFDAEQLFYDLFYKLVMKQCYSFSKSLKVPIEDLVNECFKRIWTKLYLFNPEKAKFSTWMCTVCYRLLTKHWELKKKEFTFMTDFEVEEDRHSVEEENESIHNEILRKEIISFVGELKKLYPNESSIIDAMFCRNGAGYNLPTKINFTQVSEETGVKYPKVRKFYQDVIQKEFQKRFITAKV